VLFTRSAEGVLQRLPERSALAVLAFVRGPFRNDPKGSGRRLRGELAGLRVARPGPYVTVYAVDEQARQITVLTIHHVADLWRRR
jgi:mRNA interferase RelE/StbE